MACGRAQTQEVHIFGSCFPPSALLTPSMLPPSSPLLSSPLSSPAWNEFARSCRAVSERGEAGNSSPCLPACHCSCTAFFLMYVCRTAVRLLSELRTTTMCTSIPPGPPVQTERGPSLSSSALTAPRGLLDGWKGWRLGGERDPIIPECSGRWCLNQAVRPLTSAVHWWESEAL